MSDLIEYGIADLPYSLEAEQSVLGAIILNADCFAQVLDYIKPESFFIQRNRKIFEAMLSKFTASQPIDIVTVLNAVKSDSIFQDEAEAKVYLARLAQCVPSTSHVETYAKIIQDKYVARQLAQTAQEILAEMQTVDPTELLNKVEQQLYDMRQGAKESKGTVHIKDAVIQAYDHLQKLSSDERDKFLGLRTGFSALDNIIYGLNKSDLILLAARPAMGKTSFALNIAQNVARTTKKAVMIFSLEMSTEQLAMRLMSSSARIPSGLFRTGGMSPEQWGTLADATSRLIENSIYIDDVSGTTVAEMKGKLRRIKNLGLVVIDYLQLMSVGRVVNNRVQEVSEITRNLKIMAKELDVPIILLSQLSRNPDARTDHRPVLSDLRESGSIEQDADIVMFLYRDAYYNKDSEESNIAECIIAKNRHGETNTIKLGWNGQFTQFSTLEVFRNGGQM